MKNTRLTVFSYCAHLLPSRLHLVSSTITHIYLMTTSFITSKSYNCINKGRLVNSLFTIDYQACISWLFVVIFPYIQRMRMYTHLGERVEQPNITATFRCSLTLAMQSVSLMKAECLFIIVQSEIL